VERHGRRRRRASSLLLIPGRERDDAEEELREVANNRMVDVEQPAFLDRRAATTASRSSARPSMPLPAVATPFLLNRAPTTKHAKRSRPDHTNGGAEAADLQLNAALSHGDFTTGDGNTLRIDIRDSIGSGYRPNNSYADHVGPHLPENFGYGNDLDVLGTPAAFEASNTEIKPAPPDDFF
jgi:hypothetical protein